MAKKCDFCGYQRPDGSCGGCFGCSYCTEAARLYAKYMMMQVSRNNTRNINVNKHYRKGR